MKFKYLNGDRNLEMVPSFAIQERVSPWKLPGNPGYIPGYIPRYTPGYIPGYTPGYIPGYTPGYIPGYTPGYIPGYTLGTSLGTSLGTYLETFGNSLETLGTYLVICFSFIAINKCWKSTPITITKKINFLLG